MNSRQRMMPGLLWAGAALTGAATLQAAEKPNIILIFTDDHGYTDLGIQGVDPDVRTPNIDRMTQDGVRFTDGYATAPQCVPSRAGLLTGRHQNVFGMDDNHKGPLPLGEITLADRMKAVGYVTGMVGKWHLEPMRNRQYPDGRDVPDEAYYPRNRGFDEYWYGPINRYEANMDLKGNLLPGPTMVEDTRFRVDVQTEAALSFLTRRQKDQKPFFLYLAWFAPHAPMETPLILQNGLQNYWQQMAHVQELDRRRALAAIRGMDHGLGLIRAKLAEMGQTENTLIFFISDNGAPLREGAYIGSHNDPMIGEKGMQTDGGQRIPYVLAWPGRIPGGQVFGEMVSTLDASATTLAVAGAPLDDRIEGVDLMPWLMGEKSGPVHEALYWRWRSQAAVRSGKWKFVRQANRRYLFDMTVPGKETAADNLIEQHPEVAQRLEAMLARKAATWKEPGLALATNAADEYFYKVHVEQTRDPQPKRSRRAPADEARSAPQPQREPEAAASAQAEWIARNSRFDPLPGGGVRLVPEPAARQAPFITRARVDLKPPVRVELEARSATPVELNLSWRVRGAGAEFSSTPQSMLRLGGGEWQTVSGTLPADAPIIHLRVALPGEYKQPLDVRRIVLRDAAGQVLDNRF